MKGLFGLKSEKISENIFMQNIIISIVAILLCIVVLCSLSYAWFNNSVSSDANTLGAGNFDVEVVSVIPNVSAISLWE